MSYIGRFAPSPTGPLHMGSLIAAVASYLQAKTHQGKWLIRIEDLDPPREIKGAADNIIKTLDQLGLEWDDQICYQSKRADDYADILDRLNNMDYVYSCACSRAEIHGTGTITPFGVRYAGTCRQGISSRKTARSIRLKVPDKIMHFNDRIQGQYQQNLQRDIGDFIVKRADGQTAYQLAVVVDDAAQGITEIVRGSDLLDSTPRQLFLQQLLDYKTPEYVHIPVIVNPQGEKLSKQTGATAIDTDSAGTVLVHALCYLSQQPPASLQRAPIKEIWSWAIEHWQLQKIARQKMISA
jgi:glutamyl-Q tRNA(Asp) synthetase